MLLNHINMNSLHCELFGEVNEYLLPKDRLSFSTCAPNSTSFCYEKELRLHVLNIYKSAKSLIPYVIVGNKNPLFGNEEDLTGFIDDLYECESEKLKQIAIFENISYFAEKMLEYYGYISFYKLYWPRHTSFKVKKQYHVYSPKRWHMPQDESILLENVHVSVLYGVKVPSRQHRVIKGSLMLKSLIG